MYRDPIVEELRHTAAKLVEECGSDLHEVAQRLRQEQSRHPHRIVRRRVSVDRRTRPNLDEGA